MAITVTLGGVDVTTYADVPKMRLDEQSSGGIVGICSLSLHDPTASLTVEVRATLTIVDGATTIFSGIVVDRSGVQDGLGIFWSITAQDPNIRLEEVTVESETFLAGMSDAAVIDDLFTTYLPAIDSSTYVQTIDASMEALSYVGMTLREIIDDICKRTGGRFYVDYDLRLHYYTTESNDAAFSLSTEPDMSTSFPYSNFQLFEDGGRIANKVFVLGKDVSGWGQDNDSIAEYGELHLPSRDMRITTTQGVTDRINAILDEYAWGRSTSRLTTDQDGLRAGMRVRVINSVFGIDSWLYIRTISLKIASVDGERRHYSLTLGAELPNPSTTRRQIEARVGAVEGVVNYILDQTLDTTPPNTPTLVDANVVTGVDLGDDGTQYVYLLITWGAVGDTDLAYYDVQVSAAADFSGYTLTRQHPGDGDRLEKFSPLVGNTTYYVRVRAVDVSGNVGSWSDTVSKLSATDTSGPAQVSGLVAAGARTLINLTWDANTERDLSHYEIDRAPNVAGSPGAWANIGRTDGTIFSDSDHTEAEIAAATTFWYRVRAVDTSQNAGTYSASASAALNPLGSDTLAAGSVITVKLAAGAVTADKITVATLSAISANLGTITAGTVTGATIRTAASGARIVLDSTNGIQAYNAAGAQTVSILPSGAGYIGAADKIAWNTAGSVSVDGSVLVAGTVVATAFTNAIGQPIFSAANGLLLLGPYGEQSSTTWKGSRGQTLSIAGASRREQGMWTGTRGLSVVPAAVNLVLNPNLGGTYVSGVAPSWGKVGTAAALVCTESTAFTIYGSKCQFLTFFNGASQPVFYTTPSGMANSTTYTWQMWLYIASLTTSVTVVANKGTGNTATELTTTGFHHVSMTAATAASGSDFEFYVAPLNNDIAEVYVLGAQVEAKAYGTPLAAGDMGSGYAWTGGGTAYASTTTRTATTTAVTRIGNISASIGSISMWFRVHALNADGAVLWCAGDANTEFDAWISAAGAITFYTNTGATAAGGTVVAETWHHAVFTWDVAGSAQSLYLDGVLIDTGSDGTAPALGLTVGVGYSTALASAIYNLNGTVGEFAILNSALTADEVAAIYTLQRPLVDAGALDRPGIYLLDGRFRLASSDTGARTEIDVSGIRAYSAAAQSVHIKTTGDVLFGSNITAPATTALAVFATSQLYGTASETMGAGDVLFGDNSANKANILWDASDGLLRFRGGTTTQVYISTDGSLRAGGGAIKISSAANVLFSVAAANQGLAWFSDTGFSTVSGYINVAKTSGVMTIATGGPSWGTAPDMRFDLLSSAGGGTTWTAIYIDASDKEVQVNGGSGATLSVRNNGDGNWPAFYAQQVSNDRVVAHFDQDHATAPILRLDGPWDAATEKTLGGYFKVNVNGTNRWVPYYV